MNFKSKKTSLLILCVTAVVFSRALFLFFNDPEGPNLLVVIGTAVIVYFASLLAYASSLSESKKFAVAICIQIVLVTGFYFCF